jgi:hypothetical protein
MMVMRTTHSQGVLGGADTPIAGIGVNGTAQTDASRPMQSIKLNFFDITTSRHAGDAQGGVPVDHPSIAHRS